MRPIRHSALLPFVAAAVLCGLGCAQSEDGTEPERTDPLATPGPILVQNASDLVNGDVSSPERLSASPGNDGVSLREAMLAANAAPSGHEIVIAPSLMGQTITLLSSLPDITRDSTRITGPATADGSPGVTVDADRIACCGSPVMVIRASHVTLFRLGMVNVRSAALLIQGGPKSPRDPGPQEISGVRVENSTFDNTPHTFRAAGIIVGVQKALAPANVRLHRITITGNTFRHFQGDATTVHLEGGVRGGLIEQVEISKNAFFDCTYCIELVNPEGSNNVIRNTRIVGNTFTHALVFSIVLGHGAQPPGTGNVIDSTVVLGNTFTGAFNADLAIGGGYPGASGNTTSNTWFIHNVVNGSASGIDIRGGGGTAPVGRGNRVLNTVIVGNRFSGLQRGPVPACPCAALRVFGGYEGGSDNVVSRIWFANNIVERSSVGVRIVGSFRASGNRVEDVRVVNTTFYEDQTGIAVQTNDQGSGNVIADLDVRNSIMWAPSFAPQSDFVGEAPTSVSFTLTRHPAYRGVKGNLELDPLFVAPAGGDFRLQSASPAIDRGTTRDAPGVDFWCFIRAGAPDLGAFELGSPSNACSGTLPALPVGLGWP